MPWLFSVPRRRAERSCLCLYGLHKINSITKLTSMPLSCRPNGAKYGNAAILRVRTPSQIHSVCLPVSIQPATFSEIHKRLAAISEVSSACKPMEQTTHSLCSRLDVQRQKTFCVSPGPAGTLFRLFNIFDATKRHDLPEARNELATFSVSKIKPRLNQLSPAVPQSSYPFWSYRRLSGLSQPSGLARLTLQIYPCWLSAQQHSRVMADSLPISAGPTGCIPIRCYAPCL